MFKNIDKELEKIGFIKLDGEDKESKYGVYYRRENKEYGYFQRLDICNKLSGRHLIMSYQEDTNASGFNNLIGLTYHEMKLILKKYKQMCHRYKWK